MQVHARYMPKVDSGQEISPSRIDYIFRNINKEASEGHSSFLPDSADYFITNAESAYLKLYGYRPMTFSREYGYQRLIMVSW
jgi:hypothetical protein